MPKRKMKIPIAKQIQGCRKALKNPRTPRAFIPGLKKRLKQLLAATIFVLALPALSRAQFIGYTTPQSVQQTLANGASCTGAAQSFVIMNLGQTVHQIYVTPNAGVTSMIAVLQGIDTIGQIANVSNWTLPAGLSGAQLLTATGYYPVLQLNVTCNTGGTFKATYSGSSSYTPFGNGAELATAYSKNIASQASAGSSLIASFTSPNGNMGGFLAFQFIGGAGPASSTLTVSCTQTAMNTASQVFNLATPVTLQIFPVPNAPCPNITVQYTAGGASAVTYQLSYLLADAGFPTTATASNLTAGLNMQAALIEKGARWQVLSAPAAGSQATASKAAIAGVRHVADCVSFSAGAIAAPVATVLQVNLRDGASGAGTIIWTQTIDVSTAIGSDGAFSFCGLNLIGSVNTAMTLEYSASLANLNQSVTLTGYDVQ